MNWVDIVMVVVLFASFIGGIKNGAVKEFFSFLGLLAAIPLAGYSYRLIANIMGSLPGENWENLLGFFIAFGVISLILKLVFFIPRKFIESFWSGGVILRLAGGALILVNVAVSTALFSAVYRTYPVVGGLERALSGSDIVSWLAGTLGFITWILPEVFRESAPSVLTLLSGTI